RIRHHLALHHVEVLAHGRATDAEAQDLGWMGVARGLACQLVGHAAVVRNLHGFDHAVAHHGDAHYAGPTCHRIVADAGIPALAVDRVGGCDLIADAPDAGLQRRVADEPIVEGI